MFPFRVRKMLEMSVTTVLEPWELKLGFSGFLSLAVAEDCQSAALGHEF